jgi:acyl carrier protein
MANTQPINEQRVSEVKELVSKITKIPADQIDAKANIFSDLGVDSLLGVEVFAALDRKYGINVPEEKLRHISSITDIARLVDELKARQ